jgi:hypothetical protein
LYVAKAFWKENEKDRGIYSIGIEKWNRDWITVGIVKNQIFNVDIEEEIRALLTSKGLRSIQWFPGCLPISDWFSSNKEYYLEIFFDFEEVVNKLLNYFIRIYKIITEDKDLEGLLDQAVEKRKSQK